MAGSLSSLKAAAEAVLSSRRDIVAGKALTAKARGGEDLESVPSKSSLAEHKDGLQDDKHLSVPADSGGLRTPEIQTRKRTIPTPSAPRKSTTAAQETQEQVSKLPRRISLKRPAAAKGC